jgi:hypothetical protein
MVAPEIPKSNRKVQEGDCLTAATQRREPKDDL